MNIRKLIFCSIFFLPISIYSQQSNCMIGGFSDYDCDGIIDFKDVDADNDGILNHIESQECYYFNQRFFEAGERRQLLEISFPLDQTGFDTSVFFNGSVVSPSFTMVNNWTTTANTELARINVKHLNGIELKSLSFNTYHQLQQFFLAGNYRLDGSNDNGATWIDLGTTTVENTNSQNTIPVVFNVTKNMGLYKTYRLFSISGGRYGNSNTAKITGINITLNNYQPSLYPRLDSSNTNLVCNTNTNDDIDNDGKPNHLDNDSDGDGILDTKEAFGSVITNYNVSTNGALSNLTYTTPLANLDYLNPSIKGTGIPTTVEICSNEDDPIQTSDYTTLIKISNGYAVFGHASGNGATSTSYQYTPIEITQNKFGYSGNILQATVGGGSTWLLTDEKLYGWNGIDAVLKTSSILAYSNVTAIDLPIGITPKHIRKMVASSHILALLTKGGEVYVYAAQYPIIYGNGNTANTSNTGWNKANISNIVSLIPSYSELMVLTNNNKIYHWGYGTVNPESSSFVATYYPKELPVDSSIGKIKMIASTANGQKIQTPLTDRENNRGSNYILNDKGEVWSIGKNAEGQLGIGSLSDSFQWTRVKGIGGTNYLSNIKLISGVKGDYLYGSAVSAIDKDGVPYLWGNGKSKRFGVAESIYNTPITPTGIIKGNNNIVSIALSFTYTIMLDKKLNKYGFAGSVNSGSSGMAMYANGAITAEHTFNFTDTPTIQNICFPINNTAVSDYKNAMVNPHIPSYINRN